MTDKLTVAARPCGSCPYRTDVPSGVWAPHEYRKLPQYDEPFAFQPAGVFMCHQRDGDNLCAGWLACHGSETKALRIEERIKGTLIDPKVYDYATDVPIFASGMEAARHGLKSVNRPPKKAKALIGKLLKLPGVKV